MGEYNTNCKTLFFLNLFLRIVIYIFMNAAAMGIKISSKKKKKNIFFWKIIYFIIFFFFFFRISVKEIELTERL